MLAERDKYWKHTRLKRLNNYPVPGVQSLIMVMSMEVFRCVCDAAGATGGICGGIKRFDPHRHYRTLLIITDGNRKYVTALISTTQPVRSILIAISNIKFMRFVIAHFYTTLDNFFFGKKNEQTINTTLAGTVTDKACYCVLYER